MFRRLFVFVIAGACLHAVVPVSAVAQEARRTLPQKPFEAARATLPFPVQGKIIIGFGETGAGGVASRGVVFEVQEPIVTAVCDGWVVYAGAFGDYGKIVIINAGGGYHLLLTGLSVIDVEVGQFVLTGEPIGLMLDKPEGKESPNRSWML